MYKSYCKKYLYTFIFTCIYICFFNFILNKLNIFTQNQKELLFFLKNEKKLNTILLFLLIAFIGPILEEIFFRVFFIFSNNKIINLIVSNMAFAFLHSGFNLTDFIVYYILGFLFAFIYYYTDSLKLSIFSHIVNNIAFLIFRG